ncbi:MAG: response regulator transcription factor [Flavobacteriales bacterium]
MKKKNILITEDDTNMGAILSEYLQAKGYSVTLCADGKTGFNAFAKQDFDLCILDIMMPVKDGFTLAREIRKLDKKVPLIFLTAKSIKEDRIEGFKIGGDDYITKPFSMEELLLRMEAIFKRMKQGGGQEKGKPFRIGKYVFDYRRQELSIGKKSRRLSTRESELLRLLCLNKNEVLERAYALKAVWGDDSYFNSRSMVVFMSILRKYLKEDASIEIANVHGKGFRLLVDNNKG